MSKELEKQLAVERERADYAWRNTNTIERARQEEMQKREELQRENQILRAALAPFADIRAAHNDALPGDAGFAARSNGSHVTYGEIRRAAQLLNDQTRDGAA